jgi:pilus assembly protein CpaE
VPITGEVKELTALLVAPDRDLAQQFCRTLPRARTFQVLADLKSYPPQQTLEMRLRQLKPDVVLLDLASGIDTALDLIRAVVAFRPPVQVVGLHPSNDSEVILRSLRAGASEFLFAPFDDQMQKEALARLWRLRQPAPAPASERGKVVLFSSAKPGSGASTLATQTAFALRRSTNARVLLADLDLMGGTIGFFLKLDHPYSVLDVLQDIDHLNLARWTSLVATVAGVDVLPAPELPYVEMEELVGLHDILEFTRLHYDWVILDLPSVFHRVSLLTLSEADQAFLVSTPELPSMHLTRKAVNLLGQLGFTKDRFHVVVNRVTRRDGISGSDIEKIFNCPVQASFPNDYFSLHRVVTLGKALEGDTELGKAIEALAGRLAGVVSGPRQKSGLMLDTAPALSQS